MKKLISLLIFVIIVVAFVITCPDKEKHREAIKSAVAEKLAKDMDEKPEDKRTGLEELGNMFATGLTDIFLSTNLNVKNYFVLSIGEVYFDGQTREISVGFLNHVFVPDLNDEDIKKME